MNEGFQITTPTPEHEEAMKRYRQTLFECAAYDPPLSPEEKKHILDACLTGGTIILRCRFEAHS
jgi:hypothetical protein